MRTLQITQVYLYVCEIYEEELQWHCMRHTKNKSNSDFTDQELLTTYVFPVAYGQRFNIYIIYLAIGYIVFQIYPAIQPIILV
jgi:hypothetical protein